MERVNQVQPEQDPLFPEKLPCFKTNPCKELLSPRGEILLYRCINMRLFIFWRVNATAEEMQIFLYCSFKTIQEFLWIFQQYFQTQ